MDSEFVGPEAGGWGLLPVEGSLPGNRSTRRGARQRRRFRAFPALWLIRFWLWVFGRALYFLSCFYEASQEVITTVLLSKELAFIENDEESVARALRHVEHYCSLRLPDKFLEAWGAAESTSGA